MPDAHIARSVRWAGVAIIVVNVGVLAYFGWGLWWIATH